MRTRQLVLNTAARTAILGAAGFILALGTSASAATDIIVYTNNSLQEYSYGPYVGYNNANNGNLSLVSTVVSSANIPSAPAYLYFDPNGTATSDYLFATVGNNILRYNYNSLTHAATAAPGAGQSGAVFAALTSANSVVVGPDSTVYATGNTGQVMRYNADGSGATQIASIGGLRAWGLSVGLDAASNSCLYFTTPDSNRPLYEISSPATSPSLNTLVASTGNISTGTFYGPWYSGSNGQLNATNPYVVYVGNVYGVVELFSLSGTPLAVR